MSYMKKTWRKQMYKCCQYNNQNTDTPFPISRYCKIELHSVNGKQNWQTPFGGYSKDYLCSAPNPLTCKEKNLASSEKKRAMKKQEIQPCRKEKQEQILLLLESSQSSQSGSYKRGFFLSWSHTNSSLWINYKSLLSSSPVGKQLWFIKPGI